MKITIETDDTICTVNEPGSVTTERLATIFYQAAVGVGFHPKTVAEWMVEVGDEWLQALGVKGGEDE